MKILIVDDENISRKILKKKLETVGKCTVADNSKNALELFNSALLEKKPFDLITLDVSMPKMNGKQLLATLRQKEKKLKIDKDKAAKILMVTSRMRTSTIKDCIRLGCNGYILKPVNTLPLLENLQKFGLIEMDTIEVEEDKTDTKIVTQVIQNFYKGKIKLPSLPDIAEKVQIAAKSEKPSIENLADIIKQDIAIASKLISIANSPFYKGVEKAENLNAALVRFGIKATVSLVSSLVTKKLFDSTNKKLAQPLEELWIHSFACGMIAKRIAEEAKLKAPETYFFMGVIHDIGIMLLLKAISDIRPEEDFTSPDIQIAIYEIHTTFGAALLRKMKFSEQIIRTTEFHHWNDFSEDEDKALPIIHLSDHLAKYIGFAYMHVDVEDDQDRKEALGELKSLEPLGLKLEDVLKIAEEIKPIVKDSAKTFT